MQVGFVVLHAVVAIRAGRAKAEAVGVAEDAVLLEDRRDDLWRRHLLENALVGAVLQVVQMGYEGDAVARQALAGMTLGDAVDPAMDAACCPL